VADPIYATWTDEDGDGPDTVALKIEDWPPPEVAATLSRPELHRALHVVLADGDGDGDDELYVTHVGAMVGGAFSLNREAVAALYRQLGTWLEQHGGSVVSRG
jgi:hypothetical protein